MIICSFVFLCICVYTYICIYSLYVCIFYTSIVPWVLVYDVLQDVYIINRIRGFGLAQALEAHLPVTWVIDSGLLCACFCKLWGFSTASFRAPLKAIGG